MGIGHSKGYPFPFGQGDRTDLVLFYVMSVPVLATKYASRHYKKVDVAAMC